MLRYVTQFFIQNIFFLCIYMFVWVCIYTKRTYCILIGTIFVALTMYVYKAYACVYLVHIYTHVKTTTLSIAPDISLSSSSNSKWYIKGSILSVNWNRDFYMCFLDKGLICVFCQSSTRYDITSHTCSSTFWNANLTEFFFIQFMLFFFESNSIIYMDIESECVCLKACYVIQG